MKEAGVEIKVKGKKKKEKVKRGKKGRIGVMTPVGASA
jgi:hypothetical protein